ncbi:MAG: hypothetical protein HQL36_01495 [Alphaproteobacteria bacterium]|nr:hypothetical protein [Alphaproteobacteria bacterium]
MAAPSHAFTLKRAAQILKCDEDLSWEIADQLEPEDGMLWVYDTEEIHTLAFTQRGIEFLNEIIEDQFSQTDMPAV